jgi:alanine-glyoxylate transaminase/serine-glyoxylate transaminase/serine-pyruvate transaminase
MAGLEAALALIAAEGLDRMQARHARLALAVHAAVGRWAEGGALRLFCTVPEAGSTSVTSIEVAPGVDPEALRAVARERFQVAVAGGLGPFAGHLFRIGHLGDMNEAMILGCLTGGKRRCGCRASRTATAASKRRSPRSQTRDSPLR